ncbi:hypothetical protein AB2S62_22145 [Vibrio sp. NTOU-M3]|uniref:hypothetical protein n=1 Tax=Vibrio sp. NTOU-M3 TaxID=3234954 RepID=UPI0035A876CB
MERIFVGEKYSSQITDITDINGSWFLIYRIAYIWYVIWYLKENQSKALVVVSFITWYQYR